MKFAPIQTGRLTLRRLEFGDAPAVFSYRSDPRVSKFQIWKPQTLEDVRKFIKRLANVSPDTPGTWFQLAIINDEDDTLIGDCGIRFPKDEEFQVELGISLAPSCQGQGFATETLLAVLGYIFDSLHKHRVFASVDPRNHSSIGLLNRVGMRREAHHRESVLIDGEWVDDIIYAMLEDEWRKTKQ